MLHSNVCQPMTIWCSLMWLLPYILKRVFSKDFVREWRGEYTIEYGTKMIKFWIFHKILSAFSALNSHKDITLKSHSIISSILIIFTWLLVIVIMSHVIGKNARIWHHVGKTWHVIMTPISSCPDMNRDWNKVPFLNWISPVELFF